MSMSGYTKLFNSILASTVWRSDDKTRLVWITLLAMSDKNGICEGSIPGLADFARVSVEECEHALEVLSSPDKYSRTSEYDGRRIETIDGVGWRLLNHAKYRTKMSEDERREYNRTKQAEHRAKVKEESDRQKMSMTVNDSQSQSAKSAHTDTDTDTKEEEKKRDVSPKAPPPKKGTRLPDQFFLTPEMRSYAAEKRPDVDVTTETEKFCNHFRAAPGQKGVKLNWELTWKNWILNANQYATNRNNQPSNPVRSSTSERLADTFEHIERHYPTEAELGR